MDRNPAEHEGVEFQESAVSEILRATQGYPYFPQEWGFHVWNAAQKSPIRAADVEGVEPTVRGNLIHRPPVRLLHEASDAFTGKAQAKTSASDSK